MVEVGALLGEDGVDHRGGAGGGAEEEVELLLVAAQQLSGGRRPGEDLPGAQTPAILPRIIVRGRLDIAGHALVDLEAADHRSEEVLAALVHGLGHGHGHRDQVGAGMASIAAVLPIQGVRSDGVGHDSAVHGHLARLAPHGGHHVGGLSGDGVGRVACADGGGQRAPCHGGAGHVQGEHLGFLHLFRGQILVLQLCDELSQSLGILGHFTHLLQIM